MVLVNAVFRYCLLICLC